jgi:pre-rRNA-processing protein TSR3
MTFLRGNPGFVFDATGFTLLAVDAEPLSTKDNERPLLLLDSTWRWLPQLLACVSGEPIHRSIPGNVRTAYPRISKVFEDPEAGLASIEALYLARKLLGDDDPSLLDGYHWKDQFLQSLQQS